MKYIGFYLLLGVGLLLMLFTFVTCEVPKTRGFITDDLSFIARIESSDYYTVESITKLDGKYYLRYSANRGGIHFWEQGIWERERVRLGLPHR